MTRPERTLIAFLAAAALALPAAGGAQQPAAAPAESSRQDAKGALDATDRKFVMEAARGGLAEVKLGKLAAERGASDAVKQFGQRMATDHGEANDALQALAKEKGLTLPADADAKHQKLHDRLSKLSGAAFDRAYMDEMVKDHQKDVGDFKREAQRAKDPALKAWAGKTLPTLQEHLKQARTVQAQVKGGSRAAR